ncbi:unnamed protein product [Psylliodes chrysocephalus]|uniref:MADF domain-containing protein n=1 Tax=Psylliodes chrysocephalus TaxID=3402493 RepID=A0A9P0GD91_9CUCU|nr:unnamed protein product [Psylliodes chrysocephala]
MDGEVLITLVQNYEELYNLKHSQYSNQQRRDNIWEEIGNIMKLPSKMCRERWARIRENHRRALNLRKTKSGQASKKMKTPKFDQQLTFLVPYLFDEESRHSNISKPSSKASPSTAGSEVEESNHVEEDYSQPVNKDTSLPPVTSASSSSRSASAASFCGYGSSGLLGNKKKPIYE